VFAIVECTHSFPWTKLLWERNRPQDKENQPHIPRGTAFSGSIRRITESESGEAPTVVQNADPNARDVPLGIDSGLSRARYRADPNDEFVFRSPATRSSASTYITDETARGHFAIGTGVRGSGFRAASFSASSEREIPHKLTAFRSAILTLTSLDPDITLLDETIYDLAKPRLPREPLEPLWAYFDGADRQHPRRAAIARVRLGDIPFVLFDTAARPRKTRVQHWQTSFPKELADSVNEEMLAIGILRSPWVRALTDDTLRSLMKTIVAVRGVIGGGSWTFTAFGAWRHAAIKHMPGESAEHYARRMLDRMHAPQMRFSKKVDP